MTKKPRKLISLALAGLILTTNIQPIFAAESNSNFSISHAAKTATKATLRFCQKFDKVIKIIAATGVIGTIFLSRFFYKPMDKITDDAVGGVAGLVAKIPKVGKPISKFMQDWLILDEKKNKDKTLKEQNISTNKTNISFEKDFPVGTIEQEVQAIRDKILGEKNGDEQIKLLEERIDNLEQDDSVANALEIAECRVITEGLKKAVRTPRFIMMYGPTQTGKSFTAKALAKEFGAKEYLGCTGAMLRNKYEGGSQDIISKLFDKAEEISTKTVPGIIIIDEFDGATFGSENEKSNGLSRDIAQMLQFRLDPDKFVPGKDFRNIVVIATTNYPDDQSIPAAIKARVQALIKIDNPNEAKRKSLLKRFLDSEKLSYIQADIDTIASDANSAGWNVANISRLVKNNLKWQDTQVKIARARVINAQQRKNVNLGQKVKQKANKLWNNAKEIPGILAFWKKKQVEDAPQPVANPLRESLLTKYPLNFVELKAKFDLEDKDAKKAEHSEIQKQFDKIINKKDLAKMFTKKIENENENEEETGNLPNAKVAPEIKANKSKFVIPAFKPKKQKEEVIKAASLDDFGVKYSSKAQTLIAK